jgi:hypothetical protein
LKKIIAILFLGIYLFTLIGYQVLIIVFENNISEHMIEHLDKNDYNDAELIEMKIPCSLPYASNRADYQRFDGEININGVDYNYVKRKLYNDTLYLLYIPNHEKVKLTAAKNEYVRNTNDSVNTETGKKTGNNIQKTFSTNYTNSILDYTIATPFIALTTVYHSRPSNLYNTYSSAPFQPPGV